MPPQHLLAHHEIVGIKRIDRGHPTNAAPVRWRDRVVKIDSDQGELRCAQGDGIQKGVQRGPNDDYHVSLINVVRHSPHIQVP